MLSCPPHTTHKLQPLDRSFMKHFKAAFSEASVKWMRMNPGAKITDYDISGLVSSAFTKAARLEIAQSGFKCTGIFPLDRNIFCDLDYLTSIITDIPMEFEPSTVNNTLTCTTKQHLIASHPIAPSINPSTTSTLSKISLSSKSDTKSAITDVLHVLSPIPNIYQNRINTKSKKLKGLKSSLPHHMLSNSFLKM